MATKKKKVIKKTVAKKSTRVAKSIIKGLNQAVAHEKEKIQTVYDYRMDLERRRKEFEANFRNRI